MHELMTVTGIAGLTTGFAVQLLRNGTTIPATLAAILSTGGGAAVATLMVVDLVFGPRAQFAVPGLPAELAAAISVLVAVLNINYALSVMQTRRGILAGDPAAVQSSFRAACTLVLLNAPLIPWQSSATGTIIAAAVTCLGVAVAYMGGVIANPAQPPRHGAHSVGIS
jgi:hypothetical protein